MNIITVSVRVRNALQTASFYANVLGLAVKSGADGVEVTVGTTRLELIEGPAAEGDHHFAFTIPANKFLEAKKWIQERADLLGVPGADEFECSPAWNARSLYFSGPDRSVLEFIIRRDLATATATATAEPFSSTDLLCISEVGVAVSDVPDAVARLNGDAEVAPYGGSPSDTFAPVGDANGLLILVAPGRAWFPTGDRVARESPITITAVGGRPGTYALGPFSSLSILP